MKNEPTTEQIEALSAFASQYGRYWKSILKHKWQTGMDAYEPNGGLLRQVRNQLGPVWLTQWRMK